MLFESKDYYHGTKFLLIILPGFIFDKITLLYYVIGYFLLFKSILLYFGYLIGVLFTFSLSPLICSLYSYFIFKIISKDPTKIELENRTKSFAMITHDLKTPLNSISLLSKKLSEKEVVSNIERIESSKMISQSCNMMSELIKNVLFSTKLESGEFILERKPFNLSETFERAVTMASLPAIEQGIEVGIYFKNLPNVLGDEIRFQQILNNLIGNSIKFTKKGSIIIYVVKEINNSNEIKIKVTISDTGIGIPVKDRDKLFKLFSQVNQDDQGTGLGLAICKNLCNLMKGDIGISKEYMEGSQFWFSVKFDKIEKRRSLSEELTVPIHFIKERKRSNSFGDINVDMKIKEDDEDEEDERGIYIVFYKCKKVGEILKEYLDHFNTQSYFSKFENVQDILNRIKNHLIQGIIIDENYFKDKLLTHSNFNSLKKKFAKHNFELKGKEPFYIDVSSQFFKKERKDFDIFIQKPISYSNILKMIREISNKNKEIKRKSLETTSSRNMFESEEDDSFVRRISMKDFKEFKEERVNSNPIKTKTLIKEKRLSLEKNNFEIFETPLESYQFPCKKCIIVDDNTLNRKILSKFVSDLNFQTFEAKDGVEALIKIKKEEIDFVITDIKMPIMDGFQLTKAIKENIEKNIKIIGISGDSDIETINKSKLIGMNHLLQKPLNTKELNLLKDLLTK